MEAIGISNNAKSNEKHIFKPRRVSLQWALRQKLSSIEERRKSTLRVIPPWKLCTFTKAV